MLILTFVHLDILHLCLKLFRTRSSTIDSFYHEPNVLRYLFGNLELEEAAAFTNYVVQALKANLVVLVEVDVILLDLFELVNHYFAHVALLAAV